MKNIVIILFNPVVEKQDRAITSIEIDNTSGNLIYFNKRMSY
jgi:hypothetical protein